MVKVEASGPSVAQFIERVVPQILGMVVPVEKTIWHSIWIPGPFQTYFPIVASWFFYSFHYYVTWLLPEVEVRDKTSRLRHHLRSRRDYVFNNCLLGEIRGSLVEHTPWTLRSFWWGLNLSKRKKKKKKTCWYIILLKRTKFPWSFLYIYLLLQENEAKINHDSSIKKWSYPEVPANLSASAPVKGQSWMQEQAMGLGFLLSLICHLQNLDTQATITQKKACSAFRLHWSLDSWKHSSKQERDLVFCHQIWGFHVRKNSGWNDINQPHWKIDAIIIPKQMDMIFPITIPVTSRMENWKIHSFNRIFHVYMLIFQFSVLYYILESCQFSFTYNRLREYSSSFPWWSLTFVLVQQKLSVGDVADELQPVYLPTTIRNTGRQMDN